MLINNIGTSKIIVHKNNHNYVNETKWDANYDGNIANIVIDSNNNGEKMQYDIQLNNEDLANMLTIEPIDVPIHERLASDFEDADSYKPYYIELQPPKLKPRKPILKKSKSRSLKKMIDKYILSPKHRKKSNKRRKKTNAKTKKKKSHKIHSILEEIL